MTLQERIAQLVAKHGSLRAVARATEIDVGYLSRLCSGEKASPKSDTLHRLGLRRVVSYEPLDTLQPASAAQDDASVQPSTCTWSLDDEDSSTWSSSCGELWSFIDGGPKENRVTYCHHCGKPIDVARAADKEQS